MAAMEEEVSSKAKVRAFLRTQNLSPGKHHRSPGPSPTSFSGLLSSREGGRSIGDLRHQLSAVVSRTPRGASPLPARPVTEPHLKRQQDEYTQGLKFKVEIRSKSAKSEVVKDSKSYTKAAKSAVSVPTIKFSTETSEDIKNEEDRPKQAKAISLGPPCFTRLQVPVTEVFEGSSDDLSSVDRIPSRLSDVTKYSLVSRRFRQSQTRSTNPTGRPKKIKSAPAASSQIPDVNYYQSRKRSTQVYHISAMLNELSYARNRVHTGKSNMTTKASDVPKRCELERNAMSLRRRIRKGDGLGVYSEDTMTSLIRGASTQAQSNGSSSAKTFSDNSISAYRADLPLRHRYNTWMQVACQGSS